MNNILSQYGLAGLVIGGLCWYIIRIEANHKAERKEWREMIEKQFGRMNEQTDESNKAIRENTGILQGLKTLLENKNRR